jgi:hypothetical protein
MNTDRLIDLLSANLEPIGRVRFGKPLLLAILTGSAAALILMLATVGLRADLDSTAHLGWTAAKLLFAVSVIGTASPLLLTSMRPGLEKDTHLGDYFPALPGGHRGSSRDAAPCDTPDVERDASWGDFSVTGALSPLHHTLCRRPFRDIDLGNPSRRTHAVES